jgi:hypothetical protein
MSVSPFPDNSQAGPNGVQCLADVLKVSDIAGNGLTLCDFSVTCTTLSASGSYKEVSPACFGKSDRKTVNCQGLCNVRPLGVPPPSTTNVTDSAAYGMNENILLGKSSGSGGS